MQLSEVFEQEIDPVMQALGYCCGRKYTFNPQVLCCYGKQLCTIPRDAKYYSYQNRSVCLEVCFYRNELGTLILSHAFTFTERPLEYTILYRLAFRSFTRKSFFFCSLTVES